MSSLVDRDVRAASLTVEIRQRNGQPVLMVGGVPCAGLAFHHNGFAREGEAVYGGALRDLGRLYAAGVRIVSTDPLIAIRGDGRLDFSRHDRWMADLATIGDDLRAIVRLPIAPPEIWFRGREEHLKLHLDAATGQALPQGRTSVSFTSPEWRRDARAWLCQAVAHCEHAHGGRLLGYIPAGELSYHWEDVLSDYSAVQEGAFREWLRGRYGGDEAALRRAWSDSTARFDTATIPRERTRRPGQGCLLIPGGPDTRICDYLDFHHEAFAETLVWLCSAIKEALVAAGAHKLVGTFCGYHFFDVGRTGSFHNSGQHAPAAVLASPAIDFLAVVHTHQERHPGGIWLPQLPLGTVALHGKFVFQEEDTASHRARPLSWQRPCPDARSTMGVHTRNLAGILAAGGSQWWHDFAGEGWFDDPELVAHIGRLTRIADETLSAALGASQVVVFASKRSARRLRQDATLTDALYARQVSELARLGAPCDWHLVEDLPRLVAEKRLSGYRMAVFLDAICLSEEERRAIDEGILRDKRTVLWCYAAGLLDGAGLSPERMGTLIGTPVLLADKGCRPFAETWLDGTLLRYGPQQPIAPFLVAAPAIRRSTRHREWGRLVANAEPVLVETSLQEAASWFSGVPSLPAATLRAIARGAGAHLYLDTGDQVIAGRGFLAVHAAWNGERTVRLPVPSRVEDAFTGALLADDADALMVSLRTGDTLLVRVREARPAAGRKDGDRQTEPVAHERGSS